MPSIILNDAALEDYGLVLYEGGPYLGGMQRRRTIEPWPGRVGGVAASTSTTGPSVLRFVTDTRVTTEAQRTALLDQYADTLCGTVEVRYADAPGRVMRGLCRAYEADVPAPPRWVNIAPRIVVEIECPIAHRWDAQPQSLVLGATPMPVPVGTLSHGGVVRLTGAAAGALSGETRLRYRGISGVLLAELVLNVALLSGEHLVIDLDRGTLTRVSTAGVLTDVYAWKTGGSWFKLFPRDSARVLDAFATLEVTAGVALYHFRRNWSN